MNRHTWLFLGSLVFGLTGLAAFNAMVDPYGVVQGPRTGPLVDYKNFSERTAKAALIAEDRARTVILGSSRVETAIDPESSALLDDPQPVINLGLAGTNYVEIDRVAHYALGHGPSIEKVYYFIDLFHFNENYVLGDEFVNSPFSPDLAVAEYYGILLLSLRTTSASGSVLLDALEGRRSKIGLNGFRDRRNPRSTTMIRVRSILRRFADSPNLYGNLRLSDELLKRFRMLVDAWVDRDLEVVLVFNPLHATMLELIHQHGYDESFNDLRRFVTEIAAEHGTKQIQVWDFTGYSTWTCTDPYPVSDERDGLRWHHESSHYKVELGDEILRRISQGIETRGFGRQLDLDTLDDHLANLQEDADAWRRHNPRQVELVRYLAE